MANRAANRKLDYSDTTAPKTLEITKFDDGGVTVVIPDRRRKIGPIEILVNLLIGLALAVVLIALTVGINKANLMRLIYFRPHPVAYVVLFVGFIVFLMFLGDLHQRGRVSILAISPQHVVVAVPRLMGDRKFHVPRSALAEVKLIRWKSAFNGPRGVFLKFKERPGVFVEPNSSKEALLVYNALKESEIATANKSPASAPPAAGTPKKSPGTGNS